MSEKTKVEQFIEEWVEKNKGKLKVKSKRLDSIEAKIRALAMQQRALFEVVAKLEQRQKVPEGFFCRHEGCGRLLSEDQGNSCTIHGDW